MNVAFVLLTHGPDEPAGIERAVDALAGGLRERGHRAIVVAASPAHPLDGPHVVRLRSLTLPRPTLFDDLPRLLADPEPVCREVRDVLERHDTDVVCWADAVAGLGYLDPAPPGTRRALMVHLARADDGLRASLDHGPDVVLPVSRFLVDEAARHGVDTSAWRVLPNALPSRCDPPGGPERERLRRTGPIRTLTRPDPGKGAAGLIRAMPPGLGRPLQIVLADAAFELWPGMQEESREECRALAAERPQVEILPPLPWTAAQPFLAGAALAVSPATWPETFGNVAAEAMSVGTPVAGFRTGNLPDLVGPAGRLAELDLVDATREIGARTRDEPEPAAAGDGFGRLGAAMTGLLDDPAEYHAAAAEGIRRAETYTPGAVADAFLRAVPPAAGPFPAARSAAERGRG